MTTMVGKQNKFEEALFSLCELDFDAVEAYKAAINRLENESYCRALTQFMNDHLEHIEAISKLLKKHGHKAPEGPDMKQYLTQGKVVLANLMGDKAILQAMITNEIDTNVAYERMQEHTGRWEDAIIILEKGLNDERRHKLWLEQTVKQL